MLYGLRIHTDVSKQFPQFRQALSPCTVLIWQRLQLSTFHHVLTISHLKHMTRHSKPLNGDDLQLQVPKMFEGESHVRKAKVV